MSDESEVRDRPAERGITINNILLTLILAFGSGIGTLVLFIMIGLQDSVDLIATDIKAIEVKNGEYGRDIDHNGIQVNKLESRINKFDQRLFALERMVKP